MGAISSASILLETSKAKTISTPSLFTVLSSVPIFGLTKPNTKKTITKKVNDAFKYSFDEENSGLKKLNESVLKCFLIVVVCQIL